MKAEVQRTTSLVVITDVELILLLHTADMSRLHLVSTVLMPMSFQAGRLL